jgi:putative FmdB family regulatory protein
MAGLRRSWRPALNVGHWPGPAPTGFDRLGHLASGTDFMPTYEYVCTKCKRTFEKFQSITEPPLTICPKELCARKKWGQGRVKRLIGAGAGFLFKGSGFYVTDYRSESYKSAAKKEAAPSVSASANQGSTSKSESKPSSDKSSASSA